MSPERTRDRHERYSFLHCLLNKSCSLSLTHLSSHFVDLLNVGETGSMRGPGLGRVQPLLEEEGNNNYRLVVSIL